MNPPALQLEGVTKKFGAFTAVSDLDWTVLPGCIYGLLGPNGAGKTSTIRMILGIFRPNSGRISVLGAASALAVRERIGYLPEEKGLYKKMTAQGIIAYFATLKGLGAKAARARALELLERYGLKDFATARTEALSKGMGQKVQVLASIAHDPELVILDEPFSGLDPVNQQVMEEVIRDLASRNRTVIFSTHVMEHAERLCHRILLMNGGRNVFDGTVAEAKSKVPRLVRLEARGEPGVLAASAGVKTLRQVSTSLPPQEPAGAQDGNEAAAFRMWEIELHEGADPQALLQLCFEQGIRLKRFEQIDPSLHDVFVRLIGPTAREARFR